MDRRLWRLIAIVGTLPVQICAVQAESVRMTGHFAAPYREAAMAESIRIGRFGGDDGPPLAMAIERALSRPNIEGQVHFELLGGRAEADAVLSGHTITGVDERGYKQKQKQCVEREGDRSDGKCLREGDVEVDCTRRTLTLTADLRMVRHDGTIVYTVARPVKNESSWCRGKSPPRSIEESIRSLVAEVAEQVRADLVPRVESYAVRFRESTRGLRQDLVRPFRDIVKQTQRDLDGACAAWSAMDAIAPDHPSITFDLALCAEAHGNYTRARDLYKRSARLIGIGANEGDQGATRAEQLIAGRADAQTRREARRRR